MEELLAKAGNAIQEMATRLEAEVRRLPAPEVVSLNRRSAVTAYAAVAVDGGQSMFGGLLQYVGISIFQVATSADDDARSYVFWVDPHIEETARRTQIQAQLERMVDEDATIATFCHEFLRQMGQARIYDSAVMPPRCFTLSTELVDFLRELLEWAKLFEAAVRFRGVVSSLARGAIQPVLLRDGPLRFNNMGEGHANALGNIFRELGIPILGVTKRSGLINNPLVSYWLQYHGLFRQRGPILVWMRKEFFKDIGARLERYFGGDGMRFGQYSVVRFDPLPGSRNLLAVDVPNYLLEDRDEIVTLLSGLADQCTVTAFPSPGYPAALWKAHEKAHVPNEKVMLLEGILKGTLPPEVYEFLKRIGV